MGVAVGIDLGTTYSSVATMVQGKPVVIPDAKGNQAHPSIVYFPDTGSPIAGVRAAEMYSHDVSGGVRSAKRLIGHRFESPAVRLAAASCPFPIRAAPNGYPVLVIRGTEYAIPQISAIVLAHLKSLAQAYLGTTVDKAVVTVPANFNDAQRESTRQAAQIAGLEVLRLVSEPTAAALAFGFGKEQDQRVSVYDLGGGTFDVTILHQRDRVFHVLATGGDSFLGGDDFDELLARHGAELFRRETGIDLYNRAAEWQRLLLVSEKAKCALSDRSLVEVRLPEIAYTERGPAELRFRISRDQFNLLCMDLVQRSLDICRNVLVQAGLTPQRIDGLILVGGCAQIPLVRLATEHFFGSKAIGGTPPQYAVAIGAAVQAATLTAPASPLRDDVSALLLEVVPSTISIATAGGFLEPILQRGTPIPAQQSRIFSTSQHGQTELALHIYQGDGRRIDEDVKVGEFVVRGFPAARAGEVDIEVVFEIDSDGTLSVSARDVRTREVYQAQARVGTELSDDQVSAHADQQRDWGVE